MCSYGPGAVCIWFRTLWCGQQLAFYGPELEVFLISYFTYFKNTRISYAAVFRIGHRHSACGLCCNRALHVQRCGSTVSPTRSTWRAPATRWLSWRRRATAECRKVSAWRPTTRSAAGPTCCTTLTTGAPAGVTASSPSPTPSYTTFTRARKTSSPTSSRNTSARKVLLYAMHVCHVFMHYAATTVARDMVLDIKKHRQNKI